MDTRTPAALKSNKGATLPEVNDGNNAVGTQAEGMGGPGSERSGTQSSSGAGGRRTADAELTTEYVDWPASAGQPGVADREVKLGEIAKHHDYSAAGLLDWSPDAKWHRAAARAIRLSIDPSPTVSAMSNRACSLLPHGYGVRVCLERDAGWVELIDENGNGVLLPDQSDKTIDEQIEDALQEAIAITRA